METAKSNFMLKKGEVVNGFHFHFALEILLGNNLGGILVQIVQIFLKKPGFGTMLIYFYGPQIRALFWDKIFGC